MRRIRSVSDPFGRIFDAPFSRMARTCSRMCPRDDASEGDRELARGSMSHVSDLNKEPKDAAVANRDSISSPPDTPSGKGRSSPELDPPFAKEPRRSLSTEENA